MQKLPFFNQQENSGHDLNSLFAIEATGSADRTFFSQPHGGEKHQA
jgi:hypothetical protein